MCKFQYKFYVKAEKKKILIENSAVKGLSFTSEFSGNYTVLVGFGRACAPVRCAHPSFWAH